MRSARGVTLIELMVAIAILAILLGIGVPSFANLIQNNRSTALANELVTALNYARSEAVKRGVQVDICSSSDGAQCTGNWTQGWIVQVQGGDVLRVWGSPSGTAFITLDGDPDGTVSFGPLGDLDTAVEMISRFDNCTRDQARRIGINVIGRVSVERIEQGQSGSC